MMLLYSPTFHDRLYVYRLQGTKKLKPAIYSGMPFEGVEQMLRDEYGGGAFFVMIRRGETMLLTGRIDIAPSPSRRS